MENSIYYVITDIDRIQNYIFATNLLKEIRGASAILDEFGFEDDVKNRVSDYNGSLLYSGGGTIKAHFNDRSEAEEFVLNEMNILRQKSESATLTAAVVKTTEYEIEKHFAKLNIRAERELRKNKDAKHRSIELLAHPFIRMCDSCREYAAVIRYERDERPLLCNACKLKRENSERTRLFGRFKDWVTKTVNGEDEKYNGWNLNDSIEYNIPEDLDKIGSLSDNYIGLIVCDGNRMGEKLKGINTTGSFEEFSRLIKNATADALFNAIASNMKPINGMVPCEFIILGGDDLACVVPAKHAIPVARDICRYFHQATISGAKGEHSEVSMSAGVAITHTKYPLVRLYTVADDLLKSAKRLSHAYFIQHQEVSCLDFSIISTTSTNPINIIRDKELTCYPDKDYVLYRRPYRIFDKSGNNELKTLMDAIKGLKKDGFPKTKLNQLYNAIQSKDRDQITFETRLIWFRLPEPQREKITKLLIEQFTMEKSFPWQKVVIENKNKMPITDLVELFDFIDEDTI